MTRESITTLLAILVVSACSTEPAREAAGGSAPPASPAVTDAVAGAEPTADTPVEADAGPTAVPSAASGAVTAPAASASGGGSQPAPGGAAQPTTGGGAPSTPAAPAPAAGQADEGAEALRRAAAAYERVRSLRADFVMNFENPLLRQTTTSRGTIYQQQPDRIALRFSDPDGDVILGDGRYFWVYYPSVNAQQVIRSPAAAGGEAGVNLQAQFVGNPVERFRYELHGTEQAGGRPAQVLTLVPRERAEYRSLKVWIDTRDGLARRFEITEHNGSVRRFDLQNMQVNPTIPESVFRFTPPEGARIVDAG